MEIEIKLSLTAAGHRSILRLLAGSHTEVDQHNEFLDTPALTLNEQGAFIRLRTATAGAGVAHHVTAESWVTLKRNPRITSGIMRVAEQEEQITRDECEQMRHGTSTHWLYLEAKAIAGAAELCPVGSFANHRTTIPFAPLGRIIELDRTTYNEDVTLYMLEMETPTPEDDKKVLETWLRQHDIAFNDCTKSKYKTMLSLNGTSGTR